MGTISVVSANGEKRELDATVGVSIMRTVLDNGIEGLIAECGGTMSCATCHVYVATAWADRVPAPSEDEQMMVECVIEPRDTSRLSCQLVYSDDLDGLEIEIPASQY